VEATHVEGSEGHAGGLRLRLLGDVQAEIGGRQVELGHPRQRAVLAVLAVEANRVVPVEQVIERVWGAHPPPRARVTLSGYVSRLRAVLTPARDGGSEGAAPGGDDRDGVRLARRSGGYVLEADPDAVDAHRFGRTVVRARRARTEGRRADALGLFGQALDLWRGDPFAGADTPWLNEVRTAWQAERHAVVLERCELVLAAGGHVEVLEELSVRSAGHPLDERLAGLLMLALYRSGRLADALRRYDGLRRQLASELGADPGPALQGLHQQILTADPALDRHDAATPPQGSAAGGPSPARSAPGGGPVLPLRAPRQLPMPPHPFTGRTRELAELDTFLPPSSDPHGRRTTGPPVCVVSGTAGVGKTALALHWAHRVSDRFPDGQLHAALRGFDPGGPPVAPAEAIRGFLDALGVPPQRIPATLDAQAALYRTVLAGRRMLVVLDDARDADQVRPLLPGTSGCSVVVTSRDLLTGLHTTSGTHPLMLDLLTGDDARELLAHRLGAARVAAEPEAVDEIVARCARLPLALAVVAARAATNPSFPLAVLADQLRESGGAALDALHGGDTATDARAVFACSFRALSPDVAALFRMLGLHPGPDVSASAAASLAGLPLPQARGLLADLTRAHLLAEQVPGRYQLHDLLRAYAAERVHAEDAGPDRRRAVHRALDHYLHTVCSAAFQINPGLHRIAVVPPQPGATPEELDGPEQSLAWFTAEHEVLLRIVGLAAAAGFDTHVCHLAWALDPYLHRRGHWHDQAATARAALAAARRLADRPAQARAHRMLARASIRLDRLDEAESHFGLALDLHEQDGDLIGQAHEREGLAMLWERRCGYAEALDHAQQALRLYLEVGNPLWQASAHNLVGWYRSHLGEHREALASCRSALTVYEEQGDPWGRTATLDSIGWIHHQLGDHERAITRFQEALDLCRDTGERHGEGEILHHVGDTHYAAGRPDAARQAWQDALKILEDLGNPDAEEVQAKLERLDHAVV
jgi:DNA-binding SARP family transcriptional activator/tetratricopeptide (TPR) repeat protein